MSRLTYFIVAILLSLITAFGDYCIKKSTQQKIYWLYLLILGSVVYAGTAFGWFAVLKKMKLSSVAVIYSASLILFSVLIGVFIFKEKLNYFEISGIIMALLSIILLYKFI
jgi:small multidrug resistance pump